MIRVVVDWVKRAAAWLATNPWPIVAVLGSALAVTLFRRRATASSKTDVDVIRNEVKADEKREEAEKLKVRADEERKNIVQTEQELKRIDEKLKGDLHNATDEELAKRFTDSGL